MKGVHPIHQRLTITNSRFHNSEKEALEFSFVLLPI